MKKVLPLLAFALMSAIAVAGDVADSLRWIEGDLANQEYQQLIQRQKEHIKESLAPYFRWMDEFERLYPYTDPPEPQYIEPDNPAMDRLNYTMAVDYAARLDRVDLRRQAYRDAHPASTPIKTLKSADTAPVLDPGRAFSLAVDKSRKKAFEYFPQAGDSNNPIHAKAAEIWKELEAQNSPLVHDPNAPFTVYSMAASQLGIKPAK